MKIIPGFVKTAFFALVFAVGLAHAGAGSLDTSFGKGGIALGNFGSNIFVADAILQSDGKIVVAVSNGGLNFALVRYLPTGALDLTFGTSGFAQTFFGSFNLPQSLALQSDGKIVLAGVGSNNVFAVARFNPNGSLDNTFGTGGATTVGVSGLLTSAVLVLQPNGQLLLAGSDLPSCRACSPQLVMTRFNSNGTLDTTFGNHGTLTAPNPMDPTAVALNQAGNIL